MKCSDCSKVVRPVVAIDIDGTLADYHSHFEAFASDWLDVTFPAEGYDGSERYRDWFCRSFGVDHTTFRQVKLAYRQGGMKRSMPPYPGCTEFVSSCRKFGAEVWLTTKRPHERFDRVDPDTREWLRRQEIEFDGLIYSDTKYLDLARIVDAERVVFVLDDDPEQLSLASNIFGKGKSVLRKNVHNQNGPVWTVQVGDLDSAAEVAAVHIRRWYEGSKT